MPDRSYSFDLTDPSLTGVVVDQNNVTIDGVDITGTVRSDPRDHYPSNPSDFGDFHSPITCYECGETWPCRLSAGPDPCHTEHAMTNNGLVGRFFPAGSSIGQWEKCETAKL
jgi:hypothetical protein